MTRDPVPRRVVILGLGLFGGGSGAARYFAERGARVVVSDRRDADQLRESIDALAEFPIEYRLGQHREEDFAGADVVIVNPGVRPDAPALAMARYCGAELDSEINLLFRHCRAPIAAVTGTHGKSTTVNLLGQMMRASGRRTWVGGNLGGSLLPSLDEMTPEDIVVIEMSSFQCERLAWARSSPHVALVLNITPNHLDWHSDMASYAEAKRQLLRYQQADDFAVLNAGDPLLRTWAGPGAAQRFFVGAEADAPRGARLEEDALHLWRQGRRETMTLSSLRLQGPHNRSNAGFAATAAWLLDAGAEAIASAIASAEGLPDRLELIAEKRGVHFYNDSIATTPEATMAALDSFDEPIVLIAGGSSKNLSFRELGRRIARRAKAVVLLGATAADIRAGITAAGGEAPPVRRVATLPSAVEAAFELADRGDIVLLSPACASFDMFRNYAERGRVFREIVQAL